MALFREVLLTREVPVDGFDLPAGSTFLYNTSDEERSIWPDQWMDRQRSAGCNLWIVGSPADGQVEIRDGVDVMGPCGTRDAEAMREMMTALQSPLYLDITGLPHHLWVPLIRAAVESHIPFHVVYVEPQVYRRSASPSPSAIFDLSERIQGIAPLPGFARVRPPKSDDSVGLVALLGFEGARFDYVAQRVGASEMTIVPMIGVPGFRVEYPFFAFAGNQVQLSTDYLHRQVVYARANCPFDCFLELVRVERDYRFDLMRIALLGTKPHSLGAVLFFLSRPDCTELIYDHPVRKKARTKGAHMVCEYDVGTFVESDLFARRGAHAP